VAPLRVSLAVPDTTYCWRVVLAPVTTASLNASAEAALRDELADASANEVIDPHVLLVLPAALRPTPGHGRGAEVDDRGDETPAEPEDPDALVRLLDRRSCVRVILHASGADGARAARQVGEANAMDTPAAAGGDADDSGDARPGYRVLSLINYHAGSYSTSVSRVEV
jgi:hypothetical protein